ncbi:alpha-N-acetylgalactosaminide alpha-2,6-sialyltransferase 2 isoform X2 [Embiotoca jacksoni]|uniref:alpha-N-acetylgalactosaminide alpha-2,6-sialyltransferase 2 isoform X2 n=1 Tax=Embiotoca jacksoni TaxID=100190 RepID=UPI00370393F7
MRLPPRKWVLLLLGASCFIISSVFFRRSSSQQAAGGSTEPADEVQVSWRMKAAAWWEEEEDDEEEMRTEAACSLRKAVRRDHRLRSRFRFSVPVLQWARSLSEPAAERLKNQPPPYGWAGLPVNVLQSTLPLLGSPLLIRRGSPGRCVRCAVVGNGGILRGSGQGKSIDGHNFVFRMNGAVIRGFEDDVGTKTSFYGFTTNTMKHALRWYRRDGFTKVPQSPDTRYIFIPVDLRDYVMMSAALRGRTVVSGRDRGDRPSKYFGHRSPESFKLLHPEFINYLTHSFLESPLLTNVKTAHMYMPSTGAVMLLTAIHTCDEVSAYGFITRNYASFSNHYYDSVKRPLRFYSNHDMRLENRLWEALHRQRVIKLYQRRAGSKKEEAGLIKEGGELT